MAHRIVWAEGDWVEDEAVLVLLHLLHLVGLHKRQADKQGCGTGSVSYRIKNKMHNA